MFNKFNSGIDSYYATTRIYGLHIKNFINHGVLLSGSNNSDIRNCVITSIVNNNDYKTPAIGVRIVGCNNVSVYGNNIQTKLNSLGSLAPTYGVFIDKSFYCVIGGINQGESNVIANCGNTGIAVRGCDYNKISGNSIYLNDKAIEMIYNANGGIQPPVITLYPNGIFSGTALPNSTVEIFGSTGAENANEYLVSVVADEHGEWSVEVSTEYDFFIASQIDSLGNSSNLSNIVEAPIINCDDVVISGLSVIYVNQQTQLIASGNPSIFEPWVSSNPTIAMIDNDGVVTGFSNGVTNITFTDMSGCIANKIITVIDNRQKFESHTLFLKVNDSTLNLSDFPEFLNNFGIISYEKPFMSLNTDYMKKLFRIRLNDTVDIENNNIVARLNEIDFVDFAERIPIMYDFVDFCDFPNDGQYEDAGQDYLELINSKQACKFYYPDYLSREPTIIGIIERYGVFIRHDDLQANTTDSHFNALSFLYEDISNDEPFLAPNQLNASTSHGTHVAGIAGASSNNNEGVYSIGWNNKIMGVLGFDGYLYDGAIWAAENGAKVINMSWGSSEPCLTHYQCIKTIKANHPEVIFVAAAGNFNNSSPTYPAAYGNGYNDWEVDYDPELIIAVAAIDNENNKSFTSSYGDWVDISAYGEHILSTVIEVNTDASDYIYNAYDTKSGTSMAAPIVSGIVGHMISYKPNATPEEIYNCLINTANSDIYSIATNVVGTLGSGRVDAEAALKCLGGDCSNGQPIAVITPSYPVICPSGDVVLSANGDDTWQWEWSTGETTQSITVSSPGNYYLTVTFDTDCSSTTNYKLNSANMNAEITPIENSHISINDGIACLNDNITLHASYGLQYEWSNPLWPNQQNIDIEMQHPQNPTIYVTIHDIDGCIGYDEIASVEIEWTGFYADAGDDISTCLGEEILLHANPLGDYSYAWNLKENATMSADIMESWYGPNVSIDYDYIYTIIDLVMVDNITGCTDEDKLEVTIIDPEHDEIVFDEPYTNIFCEDSEPYNFHYMHAEPVGGTWSGNGVSGVWFNPTVAGIGDHTITYTAGNEYCNIERSVIFTVLEGEVDDFEITVIHENDNPCSTTVTAYISASCYGFDGTINLLLDGDIIISDHEDSWEIDEPIIYDYLEPGSYIIQAIADIGGDQYEAEFIIYAPSMTELTALNTGPYCVGSTIEFSVSENSSDYSYVWQTPHGINYFEPLNLIENATPEMYGEYLVTITDINECIYTASTFVDIEKPISISIYSVQPANNNDEGYAEIQLGHSATNGSIATQYHLIVLNSSNGIIRDQTILLSQLINPIGLINMPAGTYTIIVTTTNPNGQSCEYSLTFIIPDMPMSVNLDVLRTDCPEGIKTNLVVNITDGIAPYTCDVIYSHNGFYNNIGTYNNLTDGHNFISFENMLPPYSYYGVIVTDANGQEYSINANSLSITQTLNNENLNLDGAYLNQSFIVLDDAYDQTLIIDGNVSFTNCRLYFATRPYEEIEETALTIKQGSTLTFDNTLITSGCPDQLWNGIDVEGDWGFYAGDEPNVDPGPGNLVVKNNSIIEYANVAVFSNLNGIISVTDSKFINCPIGLQLENYDENSLAWSTLPNLKPRAIINRNIFETNIDFIDQPISHVKLLSNDKITLKGNKFINSTPPNILIGNSRGNGIISTNSGFSVIENRHIVGIPDLPSTPQDKSLFEGLYYGIFAQNTTGHTAVIRNCEFKNYEYIGAYLRGVTAPTITSNTYHKDGSINLAQNAGLYLEGCNDYKIENNTFLRGSIGLVIRTSSTFNNTVYRNHFQSPRQAIHSYDVNSNTDGSEGLFIQCNDFHDNTIQNYIRSGNIKKEQGFKDFLNNSNSISAANQFDEDHLTVPNAFRTDPENLLSYNYKYWYNVPGDVTDIVGFASDNVVVQPILVELDENTCLSDLPGLHLDDIAVEEISDIIAETFILQSSLNSYIDGGNTQVVLQKVQSLKPNNFNKTCSDLLIMSPYLSDTVLVTFMRTNVNGHTVAKTNVLLANSPLPENAFSELDVMNLPAPHKSLIRQNQDGTNAVVQKKSEISQLTFEKDLMIGSYLRFGLQNDSLMIRKDSIVNFLVNDDKFESKCLVIPILISDKRYYDAQSQINELEYLATNEKPALQAELSEFASLQKVVIKADTAFSDGSLTLLVNNNLSLIEALAYNPTHRGCAQAQTLLSIAGIAEFEPELFFPIDNRSIEFSTQSEQTFENIDMNDLLEIYPNPASEGVWIEYLLLDDNNVSKIEIFDIEGRLVMTQSIRNGFGIEEIDVSNLSEGSYILKLGKYSKKLDVMK